MDICAARTVGQPVSPMAKSGLFARVCATATSDSSKNVYVQLAASSIDTFANHECTFDN